MAYCRSQSAVKYHDEKAVAVSLACRSWLCPDCAPDRKKRLIAEAIGGDPNTFLTLTIKPAPGETPPEAAKRLSQSWRLLRLRIIRRYKFARLPFLAVMEPHLSGFPHLHILMRSPFIPWRWLAKQMQEISGSPRLKIERLDRAHKAATYCAKYCGKCATKIGTAKRYWQSQDYDLRPEADPRKLDPGGSAWNCLPNRLGELERMWRSYGWTITRPSLHRIEASWESAGGSP